MGGLVAEAMWWVGVGGLAENKANSAPIELELELGLSLAKHPENNLVLAYLSFFYWAKPFGH